MINIQQYIAETSPEALIEEFLTLSKKGLNRKGVEADLYVAIYNHIISALVK